MSVQVYVVEGIRIREAKVEGDTLQQAMANCPALLDRRDAVAWADASDGSLVCYCTVQEGRPVNRAASRVLRSGVHGWAVVVPKKSIETLAVKAAEGAR